MGGGFVAFFTCHRATFFSHFLGLGRGKKLPEEASLDGGFRWAKHGFYRWASIWDIHGLPLEFRSRVSLNQISDGPM